jgi:transcriptional regulator with XRE-family HTH domain
MMDYTDKIDIHKGLIQSDIIDQIERLKNGAIKKTELAEVLGVSKAFVSKLYSLEKSFNLEHLAKIQEAYSLKIKFSFEDANNIRIKNDPKRFRLNYSSIMITEDKQTYSIETEEKLSICK